MPAEPVPLSVRAMFFKECQPSSLRSAFSSFANIRVALDEWNKSLASELPNCCQFSQLIVFLWPVVDCFGIAKSANRVISTHSCRLLLRQTPFVYLYFSRIYSIKSRRLINCRPAICTCGGWVKAKPTGFQPSPV